MGLYDGTSSWPENWRSALIAQLVKVSSTFGHCCQNLEVYTCLYMYIYIYISTNRSTTWRTVVFQCFRQQRYISTSTCALFCLSGEGQAILRSSTLQTLETSTLGELATWHMKGWVEHLGCSYGSPKRMLNLKPFPTNHPFVPGIMKGNPSSLGIRASKSKDVAV